MSTTPPSLEELGKIGVLVGAALHRRQGEASGAGQADRHARRGRRAAGADAGTSVQADLVERERNVQGDMARQSGKPEAVIEKMIEGRMRKFYEETVLLSQTFVIDGETRSRK